MFHRLSGRERRRGQIIPLFALVIVVLMAFAALVVDLGVLRNNKGILQNTMDAAALAGGTMMPVDGSVAGAYAAVKAKIDANIAVNYPGLASSDYQITFRCLIGLVAGAPAISRDVPNSCDPKYSLGHPAAASDFTGAGGTVSSSCDPKNYSDKCNVVLLSATKTGNFTFGRAVGLNTTSTGVISSASCAGLCGAAGLLPVDLVIIIDRTGSMSAADMANVQGAAYAVLKVYNSSTERIALGTIGPSVNTGGNATMSTCQNTGAAPGGPAPTGYSIYGLGQQVYGTGYSPAGDPNDFTHVSPWVPVAFTGMDNTTPAPAFKEQYSSNGVVNANSTLVKAISCLVSWTNGTNLDTPMQMAANFLQTWGRPGVVKGIILETDGTPALPGTGPSVAADKAHYTCTNAYNTAQGVKALGINVYTVGYGLSGQNCPSTGTNSYETAAWAGKPASTLLSNMASDPSQFFNQPAGSDLAAAFQNAATDLATKAHLVQVYPSPIVNVLAPSTGTHLGGTLVTITGKFFKGTTSVTFGGTSVAFTVLGDTIIQATAPAKPAGTVVDVVVTNPGGTSPIVNGDKYTYN